MSIDPETLQQMLEMADVSLSAEIEEPPIRRPVVEAPPIRVEEPPIRIELPPPSKQEMEAKAADELAKIAAKEEEDLKTTRKAQRAKDSFVIYCPKGCRIRVKEQYRGRTGKCPRCQTPFLVPPKEV